MTSAELRKVVREDADDRADLTSMNLLVPLDPEPVETLEVFSVSLIIRHIHVSVAEMRRSNARSFVLLESKKTFSNAYPAMQQALDRWSPFRPLSSCERMSLRMDGNI